MNEAGIHSSESATVENPATSLLVFPPYFFPTDGTMREWVLAVDGFASRPGIEGKLTTRWSIAMMGKLMRAQPHELKEPLFQDRVAPFIAKGIKRLTIVVQVGIRHYYLPRRTNGRGAFRGRLRFRADELCRVLEINVPPNRSPGQVLSEQINSFSLKVSSDHAAPVVAQAMQVRWRGWSVISDIDDTIKDTQVSPLRQLLTNTFLREFRSIDGMSEVYQAWANSGCLFHYVSSSPWQLFYPLQQLCDQEQFPAGTFHLRTFRLGTDLMRKMFLLRQRGKAVVIASLLKTFPQRRFLLVGDSGERDPEIYARVARRYPKQVQAIFIRQLKAKRMSERRIEKVFDGLPAGLYRPFEEAQELAQWSQTLLSE